MKKVAYYSFYPNDASAFYRSTAIFPYLSHKDLQIVNLSPLNNLSFADLCNVDVLFVQRPCEDSHYNLIQLAKDCKCKVIIDYDDDPLHLPNDNPMYQHYEACKPTILDCIVLADEVWVSTEAIKSAFKLYNKRIFVIPNAHNDYLFKVEDKKPFNYNKIAMYRGGHSHEGDIYELETSENIIEMVTTNLDWKFYFLGARFTYLEKHCGDNYISQSGASTIQFYKMMHDLNACVSFYPLATTLFNRSKSNICWMESVYSGSSFFGNNKLHEYGNVTPMSMLMDGLSKESYLRQDNQLSWELILDTLLLSNINKLRTERLLNI